MKVRDAGIEVVSVGTREWGLLFLQRSGVGIEARVEHRATQKVGRPDDHVLADAVSFEARGQ